MVDELAGPQSTRRGRRPAGWVVAVGVAVVLALVAGAWVAIAHRPASGQGAVAPLPSGVLLPVDSLSIGSCLEMTPGSDLLQRAYPARDCSTAHNAEVFADGILPVGPFPGQAGTADLVRAKCSSLRAGYVWPDDASMRIWLFYPTATTWANGYREYTCVAISGTADFSGDMAPAG